MPKTFLDMFKENKPEDLVKQHSVNLHERYYKIIKIYCAMNSMPIITVMDNLVKNAVKSGDIEDLINKDNGTIDNDK